MRWLGIAGRAFDMMCDRANSRVIDLVAPATQTQLDELVARASEVRIGASDTETYAHDVDELVIKLEALHQAVAETRER